MLVSADALLGSPQSTMGLTEGRADHCVTKSLAHQKNRTDPICGLMFDSASVLSSAMHTHSSEAL